MCGVKGCCSWLLCVTLVLMDGAIVWYVDKPCSHCRPKLKHDHETQAASHQTLTWSHRACKRVSLLTSSRTRLGQRASRTGGCPLDSLTCTWAGHRIRAAERSCESRETCPAIFMTPPSWSAHRCVFWQMSFSLIRIWIWNKITGEFAEFSSLQLNTLINR